MIHYFTNREAAEKLEINLARWKRWSRSFLPPDPLGGMQSGYARQYLFKDLIKVYLGGYLLSHLRLSVAESLAVINDLSPWMKKNGYFAPNGWGGGAAAAGCAPGNHQIYFSPMRTRGLENGTAFRYLVRQTIQRQADESCAPGCVVERYVETCINGNAADGHALLQDPEVRLVNLGTVLQTLVEKLHGSARQSDQSE